MIKEILKKHITNHEAYIILSNFPESIHYECATYLISLLKKNSYHIISFLDPVDLKELSHHFSQQDLFSSHSLCVVYNPKFKYDMLPPLPENIICILFFDSKIKKTQHCTIITYDDTISPETYVKTYFKQYDIAFDSHETLSYFLSFFDLYNYSLERICDNIKEFMDATSSKIIAKSVIDHFMILSETFVLFSVFNTFFTKNKKQFFYNYSAFIQQENDFFSFFYPFLSEIKRLAYIHSLKNLHHNENTIVETIKKVNKSYSIYRLQYDLKKIVSFGYQKLLKLLNSLLYIDIMTRIYDKNAGKILFDIMIHEYI